MKKGKIIVSLILALGVFTSAVITTYSPKKAENSSTVNAATVSAKQPKYVFLFIGDGMGMPQISSAEVFLGAKKDPNTRQIDKMSFTQFSSQGMSTTYAADSFIPDSASAGTAISSGNKTFDGIINMDPKKTTKYTSMAEMAKAKGMKVGVVSSVSIDHATPAVFYAHQPSRNNYYDIALELGKSNFDYFGGGGFKQPKGKDNDKPDAYEEAKKNGYKVVNTKDTLQQISNKDGKILAYSPKLDSEKALPLSINNDKDAISLADFTKKGIDVLDNNNGFFMMVEGGAVDWACHANDAATSINEVLAFNDAVKQALDFYNKHKDETLIVVTADHETGGLTLGFSGTKYSTYFNKLASQKVSYDVFGTKITDYKKNHPGDSAKLEDILPLIQENYGLTYMDEKQYNELNKKANDSKDPDAASAQSKIAMALSPSEVKDLKAALAQDPKATDDASYLMYGGYEPVTMALCRIINHKAGVAFTTYSHTGVPVPVYAQGAGEELFSGYYDDTDIFKKLTSLMGVSNK